MKNLEYKLSIDTIKAITGLKSLAKEQKEIDNTAKSLDKSLKNEASSIKKVGEESDKASGKVKNLSKNSNDLKNAWVSMWNTAA